MDGLTELARWLQARYEPAENYRLDFDRLRPAEQEVWLAEARQAAEIIQREEAA